MKAQKTTLSNGLNVIYLQIPTSQKFKLYMNVPVGAAHDPMGKQGLSHVLEHTVFCGTESTSETDLLNAINSRGGDYGAFTGADSTTYDLTASTQDPDNFTVLADIMRQLVTEPAFLPERVEIEKKVIINELNDGIDDLTRNPSKELEKHMHAGKQPHADIIGTEESIRSVTSRDLKDFMKTNYDAGHMTLFVAGPMDFNDAIEILEQTVSAIPNLGMAAKPRYEIVSRDTDIRKTRPDLRQNYTALMFTYPAPQTLRDQLIQFQANSHLSKLLPENLRSRYGCFYSPRSGGWNSSQTGDILYLTMSNTPEDSRTACIGMAEFAQNIDQIITDELINGKLQSEIYELSDTDRLDTDMLYIMKIQHERFGTLLDVDQLIQIYESITPDEVRQRAKLTLAALSGMYVQGPDPDTLPPFRDFKQSLQPASTNQMLLRRQNGKPTQAPSLR